MLITNANIITWEKPNRILEHHAILIEKNIIQRIGSTVDLLDQYPAEDQLDAGGQYVMPGNICAHTHFYGAFARGLAVPDPAPENFIQILEKLWWPLDKALTEEDIRASALVCLIDAIKHGTTTLFDHHASPNVIDGSLDIIADAVEEAGLRAVLCYEVTDRDGPQRTTAGISENVRFLKESSSKPMISAMFGLHACLTLSDKTLNECRSAAPEGTGFHFHLSESMDDQQAVAQAGNGTPVRWLKKYGILGPKSIAVHGVHTDDDDIQQLADSKTWITHQPRSNMNNAVGVAPVEKMMRLGAGVCLGNDGFSNAMWEEWKSAYLLHKIHNRDPRSMNGSAVIEMAVSNNARLANLYFPEAHIGQIKQGAFADLIFVDYHPHTPLSIDNLPWHILFGFNESMVTTTIVNGKIIMKDRQLLTLDEEAITGEARRLASNVWRRYQDHLIGVSL